jgi:putative ABC transport system permease protein
LAKKYETFKQEALKLPGIQSCSYINDDPANLDNQTNSVDWDGREPNTRTSVEQPMVGYDFVRTMKLQLLAGRDFSRDFPTDANAFILNETAAQKIGYTNPVGRSITMQYQKGTIIGIVKDFHFRSLHETIQPLIFRLRKNPGNGNILVRTQPGKTKEVLAGVETLCRKMNPQFPFSYSFSDEAYQKLYMSEQVITKLSDAFSFLAIFISCLGLLGLVMFSAEQRTKEIGIRKVMGASVMGIVRLMSADLLKLICIAILIATPIAWWAMNQWLNNYAYKITITWWMFALSGGIAVLIAACTISFQSIKAALANPAVSLKTE